MFIHHHPPPLSLSLSRARVRYWCASSSMVANGVVVAKGEGGTYSGSELPVSS